MAGSSNVGGRGGSAAGGRAGAPTDGGVADGSTDGPATVAVATSIALGNQFSCALLADRTVRCWGFNSDGELGNGKTVSSVKPVAVQGLSNAVAIAAGAAHACAVLSDSTVRCCGATT